MSFSGNVSSMSLDEVFGFLSSNQLEGVLSVQSGDEVTQRLYFADGRFFFPFSAQRGTYHLGKILRHTGVLSRDGLARFLQDQSKQRRQLLEEEESEEVQAAKRLQFTEEVHDLFLWGDARFEFTPGPWPVRVQADRDAKRGLIVETTSLLMEVARRGDERQRIRRSIPSSRMLLKTVEGRGEQVVAGLRAAKIEAERSPFDGSLSLDDLLERWGIPHHEALLAVALLVEAGHLQPVPREETRARARELLAGEDLEQVVRLLGHWAELNQRRGDRMALDLEQDFVTSPAFVSGPEETTSLRLPGPRVFTLLRLLTQLGNQFTVVLHHRGWEKRVAGLPGELHLRNERREEESTPPLAEYLVKQGALPKAELAKWRGASVRELNEQVGPSKLIRAKISRLVDELAEVVFWDRVDLELSNRCNPGSERGDALKVLLDDDAREQLADGLDRWAGVFELVPGDDCLFVPSGRGDASDPAARFFQRFSLEQNVGELRRRAQATRLEFAQFVHRGLARGYLRPPWSDELQKGYDEARAAGNDVMAFRLATAAVALGYGSDFEAMLEALRREEAALPLPFPALEGDLDGVGLAALLQALQQHRRTGTLSVKAGRREEKLHFSKGEAFILRVDDGEADEFVAFFLGDEGADSVSELGSGLASSGLVDESELSEAEIKELKDSFLDVLLWEGSRFSFFQNQLPDEFFNPEGSVSKIALNTNRFLMEAMQLVSEYEEIQERIGGPRTVYRFAQPENKLQAIQELGRPEILTLIDGRLTFDDLVRISGDQRLDVARVLRGLVEQGSVLRVGETGGTTPDDPIPDPIPD